MTEQEAQHWRERAEAAEQELSTARQYALSLQEQIANLRGEVAAVLAERDGAVSVGTQLERERDEAAAALADTVRQLQAKHEEARRQFEHDHTHLMAEAARHGTTLRLLEEARTDADKSRDAYERQKLRADALESLLFDVRAESVRARRWAKAWKAIATDARRY